MAVIIKPATILKFHKALVNLKYKQLYSNIPRNKTGRKGPEQEINDMLFAIKQRNPRFGYLGISMQIFEAFGI